MDYKNKVGYIRTNFDKRRERYAFIVKTDDYDNPEFTRKDNALNALLDVNKNWKNIQFNFFE